MKRHEALSKKAATALGILLVLTSFQVTFGIMTGSLSLWSDTFHSIGDSLSMVVAILTQRWAAWRDNKVDRLDEHYHRSEIAGTLLNAMLLVGSASILSLLAVNRLGDPRPISWIILIPGVAGLISNLWLRSFLHDESHHLVVHSVRLHLLYDAVGSFGVIMAGVIIFVTGWDLIDPLVTFVITSSMVLSALTLGHTAINTWRVQSANGILV